MENKVKIGVIGAGSWGTALANLLALKGYLIELWVFEKEVARQIETNRENRVFLPDVKLSENILPTNDIQKVAVNKDMVLIVTPSHTIRNIAERIEKNLRSDTLIVTASKGIENRTSLTMSEVLMDVFTKMDRFRIAALSGPSFAKEVARKVPTAVTAAAENQETAERIQNIFATEYFRVYTNNDVIGVEICGAIKNVIAIASGMIDGLKLGLNTRAALISRGLAEIKRMGLKKGAHPETFSGLAGVGDLTLTCTGNLSRNYLFGKKIGEGKKPDEITAETQMIAEGVKNAMSVHNLALELDTEMPICDAVYKIIYENMSPKDAVTQLMTRELKHEIDYL